MWKLYDKMKFHRGTYESLNEAMEYAKVINEFVTITNGELEFVGKFGVDEVKDPLYNGWISRKNR